MTDKLEAFRALDMDEKRLQEIEAMIATNADPEEVRYADEAWGLNKEIQPHDSRHGDSVHVPRLKLTIVRS